MKTRQQTKASIRRKHAAVLRTRRRHRQMFLSAAACAAVLFGAARALTPFGGDDTVTPEGGLLTAGGYDDGVTGEAFSDPTTDDGECGGQDAALTQPSDKSYTATNTRYLLADRMRIFTQPATFPSLTFSAKEPAQRDYIERVSDWLSALPTSPEPVIKGSRQTEEPMYLIEREFGGSVATVRLQGNRVRFDQGEWLTISDGEREQFDELLREMRESQ